MMVSTQKVSKIISSSRWTTLLFLVWALNYCVGLSSSLAFDTINPPQQRRHQSGFRYYNLHDRHKLGSSAMMKLGNSLFSPFVDESKKNSKRISTTALSLQLRGGGDAATTVGSLFLPSRMTANACTAFLGINGLLLLLAPDAVMKGIYNIEDPKDDDDDNEVSPRILSKDILHVIGSVTIGVAALLFLLTTRSATVSIEQAIGISLLPRLIVIGYKLFVRYPTRMLIVNTIVTACATTSMIFTPKGRGALACKVFPTMSLLKAVFLWWRPKQASQKFFGISDIDQSGMRQSKALLRALSNELLTSSVLMLLVGVAGMDIYKAAGWTSLLWIALLFDMGWFDETWKLMDAKGPKAQVIHLIISALLAVGFFIGC